MPEVNFGNCVRNAAQQGSEYYLRVLNNFHRNLQILQDDGDLAMHLGVTVEFGEDPVHPLVFTTSVGVIRTEPTFVADQYTIAPALIFFDEIQGGQGLERRDLLAVTFAEAGWFAAGKKLSNQRVSDNVFEIILWVVSEKLKKDTERVARIGA